MKITSGKGGRCGFDRGNHTTANCMAEKCGFSLCFHHTTLQCFQNPASPNYKLSLVPGTQANSATPSAYPAPVTSTAKVAKVRSVKAVSTAVSGPSPPHTICCPQGWEFQMMGEILPDSHCTINVAACGLADEMELAVEEISPSDCDIQVANGGSI